MRTLLGVLSSDAERDMKTISCDCCVAYEEGDNSKLEAWFFPNGRGILIGTGYNLKCSMRSENCFEITPLLGTHEEFRLDFPHEICDETVGFLNEWQVLNYAHCIAQLPAEEYTEKPLDRFFKEMKSLDL